MLLCFAASLLLLEGCKKDDIAPVSPKPQNPKPALTGETTVYQLLGTASGTATFAKRVDNSTLITIQLTDASGLHPAHIHNSADRIVIDLTNVDGNNKSESEVPSIVMTYAELINLNGGYIAVHISTSDFGIYSQANI